MLHKSLLVFALALLIVTAVVAVHNSWILQLNERVTALEPRSDGE